MFSFFKQYLLSLLLYWQCTIFLFMNNGLFMTTKQYFLEQDAFLNNDRLINLNPIHSKTRHKNINPVSKLCCIAFKVMRLLNILHHWYMSNYFCPIYLFDHYSNSEICSRELRSSHGQKIYRCSMNTHCNIVLFLFMHAPS